jgi:RNA polymerase sigma-70 factor (ECF subfamily)
VQSDETLIGAVARGDQGALRDLYDRHADATLRLIRRSTGDAGLAEDILQETWLAVWRSAGSFRGDGSVRSWLLGVARRQAYNRLRRNEAPPVDDSLTEAVPDAAASVEEEVLDHATEQELARLIATLPEHLQEVLYLVLVDELRYREVAGVLAIPVGTVKSRMSHARRRLAELLQVDQVSEGTRS